MKMSREDLKQIVKECLVQILSEGLSAAGDLVTKSRAQRHSRPAPKPARQTNSRQFSSSLDSPVQQRRGATSGMQAALAAAVKMESKGDSVLADILAETAVTTLPQQLDAEGPMSPDLSELSGRQEEPETVFDDSTGDSHWADVAFAAPVKH